MSGVRFYPEGDKAEVYGLPGVKWQQRGNYFRQDGSCVSGDPDRDRELAEIKTKLTDPATSPEVADALRDRAVALHAEEESPAPAAKPPTDDMRLRENRMLKEQLAIYGEEFTTVAAARKFLDGRGPA